MKIHFAPLQGFTEAPYRKVHSQVCGGVDTYYTPFIRLEHGAIRGKDLREALPENNEGVNVVPQVIASDASEFVPLVEKLISVGHHTIDINMGCPFPLQTRIGRGSGILPHADKVEQILDAARRFHDEKGISFSVKMRLGQEEAAESMRIMPLLNRTPLIHITLHPRVGRDQYKGELDMDAFAQFYGESENPVVFNGMLTCVEEIKAIEKLFPELAGIMIGRGMLTRPTLASDYRQGADSSDEEVRQRVMTMHRQLFAHYQEAIEGGEAQLVQKMHAFWEYQEPIFGHKGIKKVLKSGNLHNYLEAVANLGRS